MNPEHARSNMVERQLRPWGVLNETVLDTFRFLPREKFVLPKWQNLAFADIEIPLGKGETMMNPRVEARMLQELAIQPTDHCLEIGTGSGFVTACLAHLGQHVDSVELRNEFSHLAETRLNDIKTTNFNLYNDDASEGWQGNSDKLYDVIAVTGSVPKYITAFEERLAIGGRLFIISGKQPAMHALLVTRENEHEYSRNAVFETSLPPLAGSEVTTSFEF